MNEKSTNRNILEVDTRRVCNTIWQKAWLVALACLVGAVVAFVVTLFFITPQYQSEAMFYVNNSSISVGETSLSISSGDITASKDLVDTYIVILNTRETLNDVIDYADVDMNYQSLQRMIEASSVNDTEVFRIVVTSPDPEEAEAIASAIAYILPKRISSIVEGTSAKIVDSAVVPVTPSSPDYVINTMVGFILGFVLVVGGIILHEIFDTSIRTEDDIAQVCTFPVLASVPHMASHSKGSYYYDSKKHKSTKKLGSAAAAPVLVGSDISFSASEAYKLLRTKIQFSFADNSNCRVIGVSSALSGEGKSLTAVNLAYTLSELNKKVILIDCDMRRPTLAEKLKIRKKPGLSSYLTGQSPLADLIQYCNFRDHEKAFHVITAGQNPPNPVELLSSARMKKVLEKLRAEYDYVILDLPPVGEVTDAMAVANETDGMLLVVRQNYCDRVVLTDAARQFQFIRAKIIGTVFNCTSEHSGSYSKGYYKRYYRRYYSRYRKSNYENNDRSVTQPEDKHSKV